MFPVTGFFCSIKHGEDNKCIDYNFVHRGITLDKAPQFQQKIRSIVFVKKHYFY